MNCLHFDTITCAGFSLGILKHASGTPCLAPFGISRWKICVQASGYKDSWYEERLAGPIDMSEIVLLYVLSNLTKRSGELF